MTDACGDDELFEDVELDDDVELSSDSSDRTVLAAIWTKTGRLPPADRWVILHERYPADVRIRAAMVYELVYANEVGDPPEVIEKVEELAQLANGKLGDVLRDILACAELDDTIERAIDDPDERDWNPKEARKRLVALRKRVGPPLEEPFSDGPVDRLDAFEKALVRELHDVTVGDKPIAKETKPKKRASKWKAPTGPGVAYDPNASLAAGVVIVHPKFGKGMVSSVSEGRASVQFESGERKLTCR